MMTWFTLQFKICKADDFTNTEHYENFADLDNAKYFAKALSTCGDVIGDIDVIDANTGEIMATYCEGKATYVA